MGANVKSQDIHNDASQDNEVKTSRRARKVQRVYIVEMTETPSQLSLGPSDIQPIQIFQTKHEQ